MIEMELERLLQNAKQDAALRQALLDTRAQEDPVAAFCALCLQKGYAVTEGELLAADQNANDAKLRSVNGGGVDAIDGWDDAYEQFFMSLLWSK